MAEIHVNKKKNRSFWPWILGLAILVGLIWVVAELFDRDDDLGEPVVAEEVVEMEEPVMEIERTSAAPAVEEYIRFSEENANVDEMSLDHEYTSMGIEKLTEALNSLALAEAGNVDIEAKRQTLMQAANSIEEDPMAATHANSIRDAFMAAADLMQAVQRQNYPELGGAVSEVKTAAENVDPDVLTLDQKEAVKDFFDQAANALEQMSMQTAG